MKIEVTPTCLCHGLLKFFLLLIGFFPSRVGVRAAGALVGSSLRVVGCCSVQLACPTPTAGTDSLEDRIEAVPVTARPGPG